MVDRDRILEDNSDIRPWVRIGEVLDAALDVMVAQREVAMKRDDYADIRPWRHISEISVDFGMDGK